MMASAENAIHDEVISAKIHAFAQFLQDAIPSALVPEYLADLFRDESNARFDRVRKNDIPLDQIYIGEDCLPAWPSLCWDPDSEPLGFVIQQRLLHYDLAQGFGNLMQREIQIKGNRRLRKAQALGISIDDIAIGKSLLPEWINESTNTPCSAKTLVDDDSTQQVSEAYSVTSTSVLDEVAAAAPSLHNDLAVADVDRICSSDSEDDEDASEEISMNNLVSTQPIYDEYGHGNIVHDVDMVGGLDQSTTVDLEVYLAVDDEEWEALPDVELSIDREAFEYYFCTQDAIDIDIPGAQIFCCDKLEDGEVQQLVETERSNQIGNKEEETGEQDNVSPQSEDDLINDFSDILSNCTSSIDSTLCSEED